MLRDHDNMLKNLRQEVNSLKDKSDHHDKNLETNNQTISDHEKRLADVEGSILLLKGMSSSG